ncbi:MAG TPA: hypothetical protein VMI31_12190, partial [Fimbriimonadaceae bacterium]|nr:hypothetical protein [Fimbriimonadaceae bacterium]
MAVSKAYTHLIDEYGMDLTDTEETGGMIAEPQPFTGGTNNHSLDHIRWVARRFEIPGPVSIAPFPGRGNINLHTYSVAAEGQALLLQKVNSDVFT